MSNIFSESFDAVSGHFRGKSTTEIVIEGAVMLLVTYLVYRGGRWVYETYIQDPRIGSTALINSEYVATNGNLPDLEAVVSETEFLATLSNVDQINWKNHVRLLRQHLGDDVADAFFKKIEGYLGHLKGRKVAYGKDVALKVFNENIGPALSGICKQWGSDKATAALKGVQPAVEPIVSDMLNCIEKYVSYSPNSIPNLSGQDLEAAKALMQQLAGMMQQMNAFANSGNGPTSV